MIEFLRWPNQADADTSLAAVEVVYDLPFSDGDYVMNDWANVTQSDTTGEWGFYKPQLVLGVLEADLTAALVAGFTETATIPDDWIVDGGGGTLTLQQGADGYTGATSIQMSSARGQNPDSLTHYHRYGGANSRFHNFEHFAIDFSGYGDVISATLTIYNVPGGGLYIGSDVYLRQILDPDGLGGAYPTGWAVAASSGNRNGANRESRDDTSSPDTKWQSSNPDTPDDLGADYLNSDDILKPIAQSSSYTPNLTADASYDIDVTTDVTEWKSGTPNQGWNLFHDDDNANIQNPTATSNYIADITKCPKLVIVFAAS